ncbi:hypothetical protein AAZX31_10G053000 [Glycine max]|nr:hypothetical protein JHK87_026898 [Glycine soja]
MVRVYSFSPYSRAAAFQNHSQDDTYYTIKCQILSLSRCISLNTKLPAATWTFQAPCIIFLKTGLICIWRILQNVDLCSIIGKRQLKLELDENIFVKPCPSKLA